MSVYSSELLNLSNDATTLSIDINRLAESAKSSTTLEQFNARKAAYEARVKEYETLYGQYQDKLKDYERYVTVNKAQSSIFKIPNMKDKNQHLAGGVFGSNGTMPGGPLWSPTNTSKLNVGQPETNNNTNLLNGNILSYLGYGFGDIMYLVNGGKLDLMFNTTVRSTSVIKMTVELTTANGTVNRIDKDFTVTEGEGNLQDMTVGFGDGRFSLQELSDIASFELNVEQEFAALLGQLAMGNMAGALIGISLYDYATGSEISTSKAVGKFAIGQVVGMLSRGATTMAINSFGMTSFGAILGLGYAITSLIGEAFEVAVGLDMSFGPGGQFLGTDSQGRAVYGRDIGIGEFLGDVAMEIATLGFADTHTFNGYANDAFGYTANGEIVANPSVLGGMGDMLSSMAYGFDINSVYGTYGPMDLQIGDLKMADMELTENRFKFDSGWNEYSGLTQEQADRLNDIKEIFGDVYADQIAEQLDQHNKALEELANMPGILDNYQGDGGGSPTGSGESSGLGIGDNRGGAGGFGSAADAAAGGHTGGF